MWKRCKKEQTIPIYTNGDYLLDPSIPSPKAEMQTAQYFESNEIKQFLIKNSGLRQYLAKYSGMNVDNIFDLIIFYDALHIERNNGLM